MKKLRLKVVNLGSNELLSKAQLKQIVAGTAATCNACEHSNQCPGSSYCINGCCSATGGSGCVTCTSSNECSGSDYCAYGCCATP